MKPRWIQCTLHGVQDEAFVCQHIAESLHARTPVGFFWSADDPSRRPDAWCSACNDRVAKTGGEWTGEALAQLGAKLLCGLCYDEARSINLG